MKKAACWIGLFLLTALFSPPASGELVAFLDDNRLKVFNEKGGLLISTRKVQDFKEAFSLVGYSRKDTGGRLAFNLLNDKGKVVYKSYDVKDYFIGDEIAAVVEYDGTLKVIDPTGAVTYSDNKGFDTIQLSIDFLAYMKGDRLNVVLSKGKRTLSINKVDRFSLKETFLVYYLKDDARVIATRNGKTLIRESTRK